MAYNNGREDRKWRIWKSLYQSEVSHMQAEKYHRSRRKYQVGETRK